MPPDPAWLSVVRCGHFHVLRERQNPQTHNPAPSLQVERILERVRLQPGFLSKAEAALGVFERQSAAAAAHVATRLAELGCQPGQKLRW